MKYTQITVSIFALSSLLVGACKNDEKAAKTKTEKGERLDRDSTDKAATPTPTEAVDAEIMAEFKAVANACEIDTKVSKVNCPNAEDKKLKSYFFGREAKSKLATIATVAEVLADPDPRLQTLAAVTLSANFGARRFGKDAIPGSVHKKVSQKLRDSIEKLAEVQALQAITPTVFASGLSNSNAEAFTLLDGISSKQIQATGWGAVMVYGRMSAFDKIKEMAASRDPFLTRQAMKAVSEMRGHTAEELAVLCPWATTMLGAEIEGAPDSYLSDKAGLLLSKCGEKSIDAILDWGESQLAKGIFTWGNTAIYHTLCRIDGAASPTQCSRAVELMSTVASSDTIEPKVRGRALTNLARFENASGDKKILTILKKFAQSDVPKIKKAADLAIIKLEK